VTLHSQWSMYFWVVRICRTSGRNTSLLLWKTFLKRRQSKHDYSFYYRCSFLPDRDYVTFRNMLSQIHLSSVVCNLRSNCRLDSGSHSKATLLKWHWLGHRYATSETETSIPTNTTNLPTRELDNRVVVL